MVGQLIGRCRFTDGATRPVYAEGGGQYTYENDGKKVYGLCLIPREEWSDLPVIVDTSPAPRGRRVMLPGNVGDNR